jgi:hypothetical protein
MARPALEIADIFHDHGPAWRQANAGHVSLGQLKVMSAIESCRTVALGGHIMRCEDCLHTQIAYNSCRNRHCSKCQGSQALAWMKQRKSELLDVPYFHVVFTLPARIAAIAYQNEAVVYDLLFKASSQTMRTIAADPKHLGVKIGFTSVLHTWGSAMTHHPHVHMIVPGGGISLDGTRWIGCCDIQRWDRVTHLCLLPSACHDGIDTPNYIAFATQYLACTPPCQRFACCLAAVSRA